MSQPRLNGDAEVRVLALRLSIVARDVDQFCAALVNKLSGKGNIDEGLVRNAITSVETLISEGSAFRTMVSTYCPHVENRERCTILSTVKQ